MCTPSFMLQLEQVPLLVLYQLVMVNYGAFASPDDAEAFGAGGFGPAQGGVLPRPCAGWPTSSSRAASAA